MMMMEGIEKRSERGERWGSSIFRLTALWKFKDNPTTRQTTIDLRVSVESIIHSAPLLLVQDDLEHFTAILARPDALAHNLDGIDEIVEHSFVYGGQGPGTRSFLFLGRTRSFGSFRPREDPA